MKLKNAVKNKKSQNIYDEQQKLTKCRNILKQKYGRLELHNFKSCKIKSCCFYKCKTNQVTFP